jgi:hypothetical protein
MGYSRRRRKTRRGGGPKPTRSGPSGSGGVRGGPDRYASADGAARAGAGAEGFDYTTVFPYGLSKGFSENALMDMRAYAMTLKITEDNPKYLTNHHAQFFFRYMIDNSPPDVVGYDFRNAILHYANLYKRYVNFDDLEASRRPRPPGTEDWVGGGEDNGA